MLSHPSTKGRGEQRIPSGFIMHTLPTVTVGQGKKNPGAVPGLDKPITWLEVLSALNCILDSITLYIPVLFGLGIRIS